MRKRSPGRAAPTDSALPDDGPRRPAGAGRPGSGVGAGAAPAGRARIAPWLLLPLALAVAEVSPALAQGSGTSGAAPDGARLEAVRNALDSGRVEEARRRLEAWSAAGGERAGDAERAEADLLRARLAPDATSARRIYARLALEAGPAHAAPARLRLGQLRLAEGEARQAMADFALLRADFPAHPLVAESWLWTALARREVADARGTCEALVRALAGAEAQGDRELAWRVRAASGGCDLPAGGPAVGSRALDRAAAAGGEGGGGADGVSEASAPGWTVQIGAFSTAEAAERQRERAGERGFESRTLPPERPGGFFRVRVGRFAGEEEARAAAARIRDAGLQAVVVRAEGGRP